MATLVLVELKAKPELRNKLMSVLETLLPETRDYDGCIKLDCHVNQSDDCDVVLIELWESAAHHKKYVAWRTEAGGMEKIAATLAGPPNIRYFDGVDV